MDNARRTFRIDAQGLRLDQAVARQLEGIPGITRARARGWVEEGRVRVNGQADAKPSRRLSPGDEVEVHLPPPPPRAGLTPLEMPLSVVHEDDWLLALDKPPGLVVHPAYGNREGTLMHALLWHARSWREGGPHLVSRLDQGTSGLILVAKAPEVHAALQRRGMEKDYLAVVHGRTAVPKGRIDLGILRDPEDRRRRIVSRTDGRPSATLWERLAEAEEPLTLLRCRLLTGRTHQIRVHLQASRLPIVGDPLYGPLYRSPGWKGIADPGLAGLCRDFPRQALHAWRLRLTHPVTGERLDVQAPVPPDLAGLLAGAGIKLP
ncbi:MAG TPA: RluA family pseudouridine synthase [Thermoanaerobaculia bacterium]|nr:RluA family pseudouridine synthase [Thermoanaerobaculia bacterium]